MYPIYVPCNLHVRDEQAIYRKLINQSEFKDRAHIAHFTLDMAALFAVLTRLQPSKAADLELLKKAKHYNGEAVLEKEKGQVAAPSVRASHWIHR